MCELDNFAVHPLLCLDPFQWEDFLRTRIQTRAYHLWENAGRPDGRDAEFWVRARNWEFKQYAFYLIYKLGLRPRPLPCPVLLGPDLDLNDFAQERDHAGADQRAVDRAAAVAG